MAEHEITVGLVIERITLTGPWSDHVWMPSQVLMMVPDTPPWTAIMRNGERVRYFAGAFPVRLHPSSTAQYRDNLTSVRPSLWVAMRPQGSEPPVEIVALTADPSEGEGYTETGTNVVEAIAMPAEIAAWVDAFVTEHHVERVFEKRKRDPHRPDSRRPASSRPDQTKPGPAKPGAGNKG